MFKRSIKLFLISLLFFSLNLLQATSGASNGSAENPTQTVHTDIANLEAESSTIVDHINIITGDYVEFERDLSVVSPVPLHFERSKDSSGYGGLLEGGWNHNLSGTLFYYKSRQEHHHKHYNLNYRGPHGENLYFEMPRSSQSQVNVPLKPLHFKNGLTNCGSGYISGKTNLKNTFVLLDKKSDLTIVKKGDGSKLYFNAIAGKQCHILKEVLPTGNEIHYEYEDDLVKKMITKNHLGKELSWLEIRRPDEIRRKHNTIDVVSSDGQVVSYSFLNHYRKSNTSHFRQWYLSKVLRQDRPNIEFFTIANDRGHKEGWITRKLLPDHRYTDFNYYLYESDNQAPNNEKVKIKDKNDFRNGRVSRVLAPLGTDLSPLPKYQFKYEASKEKEYKDGTTTVWNAHGTRSRYQYENKRLTSVQKYTYGDQLFSTLKLKWGDTDSSLNCNLLKRTFEDGQGHVLLEKGYLYDNFHNVTHDEVYGTICAEGQRNYVAKRAEYSQDGMNRLLWQKEGEVETNFTYYPERSLVYSKIEKGSDGLTKRTFYIYDDNAVICQETVDDGTSNDIHDLTGVTERRIRNTTPNDQGLPVKVVDLYLDEDGEEKQLRKELSFYSPIGRLMRQEVYDSQDDFMYELKWDYDAMGHVIYETNALGHEIHRNYDQNGNLIYEQGPTSDFYKVWVYDFMNRMIRAEEIHNDKTFTTHCRYDLVGNRIQETDSYGNSTDFVYDMHNQLVKIQTAPVFSEDGHPVHIYKSYEFDCLGRQTADINPKGERTAFINNVFNKPLKKCYPDGTYEETEYNHQNLPVRKREINGLITTWEYDSFGRVLKESVGERCKKQATYSTFHLLSETDPAGLTTYYEYNRAGQKISEIQGRKKVGYAYDSMGRVSKITSLNMIETKGYDFLNRLTEEATYHLNGDLISQKKYVYDAYDRKTHTLTTTEEGTLVDEKRYDSKGNLIWHKDTAGSIFHSVFIYDYYNEIGQRVGHHELIDPLGLRLITTLDALGRTVQLEQRGLDDRVLQKKNLFYDLNSNCVRSEETVFHGDKEERKVVNAWEWDSQKRLCAVIEAVNTLEQKKTRYLYNTLGQKNQTLKPDGQIINYDYDLFGLVESITADGISYHYTYDVMNRPIIVEDLITGMSTIRVYDEEHYLIEETLANDLTLSFKWLASGQMEELKLPCLSSIGYRYEGTRIADLIRFDINGDEKYRASYKKYDLQGQVREMMLPGNLSVFMTYDALSRVQSITTKDWKQTLDKFDLVGNLHRYTIETKNKRSIREFSYDRLNQLASENAPFEHKYEHDSLYNLINKDGEITHYNALNQPLDKEQDFDRNGNLVKKGNLSLSYDTLDRLIKVEREHEVIHYTYDAFNRRIKAGAKNFIYQGQDEIGLYENGKLKEFRILGLGKGAEIGASLAFELNGEVFAPIHDHNGNVSALYTINQELVSTFETSSFGQIIQDGTLAAPWLYSSKRLDYETGFYNFGRRYYDPSNHRFITADPIKFDGGANLYAYCLNNPLTNIDPYGLSPFFDFNFNGSDYQLNFGRVAQAPGRFVEDIGKNWMPVPIVRDGFEVLGKTLSGRSLDNHKYSWQRDHSCAGVYKGTGGQKNMILFYTNGMATNFKQFNKNLKFISDVFNGSDVHFVYNGSRGTIYDLGECLLQKLSIATNPDILMRKQIKDVFDECDKLDPNKKMKMVVIAHSQGVLTLNNAGRDLDEKYRERMMVATFGGATTIPRRIFGEAINYFNRTDFIPWTDPIGRSGLLNNSNIVIFDDCGFGEHGLLQESYSKGLRMLSKKNNQYFR